VLESNGGLGRTDSTLPGGPILESIERGFPAVREPAVGAQGASLDPLMRIPDVTASGSGISYSVPHESFIHTDGNAVVTLEARLVGGAALPGWLSFDGVTGLLNGSLRSGDPMPSMQLEIIARDQARREARSTFTVFGNERLGDVELASTDRGFPAVRMTFEQLGIPVAQRGVDLLVRFHTVPDQRVEGGRLSFSVPNDAFAHTDPRAVIRLEARLANGDPLPAWITFNSVSGRLGGIAPVGFEGVLRIHVTARDQQGLQASTEFTIEAGQLAADAKPLDKPTDAAPERAVQGEGDAGQEQGGADKPRDERAGRPAVKRSAAGFGDQLRAVRDARPGAKDAPLLARALAAKPGGRPAPVAPKS
jgi:Putative Ig domain